MSLNRVTISGRLSRDLELRRTQSGTAVASFTLAVDGDFKDKQTGERPTYWIDCVAWSTTAEFMSRYIRDKGSIVVLDGRLQTRAWTDKEGNKRKSVEVVADHVYFGDSRPSGEGARERGGYSTPIEPNGEFRELTGDDGDLPF